VTRRALLFGSSYDGIEYASNSVNSLGSFLHDRLSFEVTALPGDATRQDILDALEELPERVEAGDTVVLYFCGHSGSEDNRDWDPDDPNTVSQELLYLAPADYDPQSATFRGVLSWELSLRVEAITDICPNVTMILDCCGAPNILEKLEGSLVVPVVALFESLHDEIRAFRDRHPLGNATVVKVTGSGTNTQAFRVPLPTPAELAQLGVTITPSGNTIGAVTLAVIRLLAGIVRDGEVGAISWRKLSPALEVLLPRQSPQVIGPIDRIPFSLEPAAGDRTRVGATDTDVILYRGSLAGVCVGDVYGLVDGSELADTVVGQLTVTEVLPTRATAELAGAASLPPVPAAIQLATTFPRYPVVVDPTASALAPLIARSWLLRVATMESADQLATVRRDDRGFEIAITNGPVVVVDAIDEAMTVLDSVATVRRLRGLTHSSGWTSRRDVDCELLRYRDGAFTPVTESVAELGPSDRLAVRVTNLLDIFEQSDADRYVNVLYVDPLGRIALLAEATMGAMVDKAERLQIPEPGELSGFVLDVPDGLDASLAHDATLAVVVSTEPVDLRHLANGSIQSTAHDGASPRLFEPLAETHHHASHVMPANSFRIEWIDLRLVPESAAFDRVSAPSAAPGFSIEVAITVELGVVEAAAIDIAEE